MANVQKYNRKAFGNLVAHYTRSRASTLDRANIDRSRTHLNYDLRPHDVQAEVRDALAEHERVAGRSARTDAVVLVDWCVTLPGNVPAARAGEFFESVVRFCEGRYSSGKVLGAYVHMDEATPHVHVALLPTLDGKLQASKLVNRADLKTFHEALRAAVSADMGFDVEILLDESKKAEKELSRLSQADYIAAKKEIAATSERLERVRRLEAETRGTPLSDFRESREESELDREIADLERAVEGEERAVAGLARDIEEEERGIAGLDARIQALGGEVRSLGVHVEELRQRVGILADRLREGAALLVQRAARALRIKEPYQQAPKRVPVPEQERDTVPKVERQKPSRKVPAPAPRTNRSPAEDIKTAQAAARALSSQSRGRGAGRGAR